MESLADRPADERMAGVDVNRHSRHPAGTTDAGRSCCPEND